MEATPSQDQVHILNGPEGLAPVGEWGLQWSNGAQPMGYGELPDIAVKELTIEEIEQENYNMKR